MGILLSLCLSVSLRISLSPSVALVSLPGTMSGQVLSAVPDLCRRGEDVLQGFGGSIGPGAGREGGEIRRDAEGEKKRDSSMDVFE